MEYRGYTLKFTHHDRKDIEVAISHPDSKWGVTSFFAESIMDARKEAEEFLDSILPPLKVEEPEPEYHSPRTLEDLVAFHRTLDIKEEDYFSLSRNFHFSETIFAQDTRWVAVYWVEGGSEGYYLHIDRQSYNEALEKLVITNVAIGKYWSIEAATKAVALLTPFVHGLHEFVKASV